MQPQRSLIKHAGVATGPGGAPRAHLGRPWSSSRLGHDALAPTADPQLARALSWLRQAWGVRGGEGKAGGERSKHPEHRSSVRLGAGPLAATQGHGGLLRGRAGHGEGTGGPRAVSEHCFVVSEVGCVPLYTQKGAKLLPLDPGASSRPCRKLRSSPLAALRGFGPVWSWPGAVGRGGLGRSGWHGRWPTSPPASGWGQT